MVTLHDDQIWRGDTVIGTVSRSRGACYDIGSNTPLGWYEGDRIYHVDRGEIGYIEGDYIHYYDTTHFARVDDIFEQVAQSDAYYDPKLCATVAMLFGKD